MTSLISQQRQPEDVQGFSEIIMQWCYETHWLARQWVYQLQRPRMQCLPANPVTSDTVELITYQRMPYVGHVQPDLVCAARSGQTPDKCYTHQPIPATCSTTPVVKQLPCSKQWISPEVQVWIC